MDSAAGETLRRTLGNLMHEGARLMRRRFAQLARETALPLNQSEATVLVRISRHEGATQAAVAQQLDIEPIALVHLLDGLQAKGLVERRPSPTDRRVRTLWLGPEAAAVIKRIVAIRETVRNEAFAGMVAEQREELLDCLAVLGANLRQASTQATTRTEA